MTAARLALTTACVLAFVPAFAALLAATYRAT